MSQETTVPVATDLVVVIDTSGSMEDEAAALSKAAETAIEQAKAKCSADLHEHWFGIEGTWDGTKFTRSYRDYLVKEFHVDPADLMVKGCEDGAAAVIDLAEHFEWRPHARRAIFYLGDEALADGDPHGTTDEAMRDEAIQRANEKDVVVFTYRGTPYPGDSADGQNATTNDYRKLAEDTHGKAFVGPASALEGGFEKALETIVCKTVTLPPPEPRTTNTWICSDPSRLYIVHEYVRQVELVDNAYVQGTVTVKNEGATDYTDVSVELTIAHKMVSWGLHFTSGDSERLELKFRPLPPGGTDSRNYTMKLFQTSGQPEKQAKYRIIIDPKFTCVFTRTEARKAYHVDAHEPAE